MPLISRLFSLSLLSFVLGARLAEAQTAATPDAVSTQLAPPAQAVDGAQGRELTLEESIARAAGRSYSVIKAENNRDAATEAKRMSFAQLGPTGVISYNQNHFEDTQVITDFGPNPILLRDKVTKTGSLVVTQPITGLYGFIENARLGDLNEDLANETLRKERVNAGFSGAEAFLNAYNLQEQVLIAELAVAGAQASANDASVSQRVGRMNQADFLRLQVNLSQAQSKLARFRADRVRAIASLRQILRMPPEEVFYLKRDLPTPTIDLMAIEAAIAEAMEKRPDVKVADMEAEVASFQKKAAYTEFIPKVEAFVQVDRNFGEITALGNQDRDVQYWGLKANWSFWNNGASVFKTREAFARTRAAEAGAQEIKDKARVDVIAAVEDLKASREALQFAETGVKQAEEAYRIDGVRFKNGSISATDQIISENTKATVQGQYVDARTQLLLSYFRLQRALGKDQPSI